MVDEGFNKEQNAVETLCFRLSAERLPAQLLLITKTMAGSAFRNNTHPSFPSQPINECLEQNKLYNLMLLCPCCEKWMHYALCLILECLRYDASFSSGHKSFISSLVD